MQNKMKLIKKRLRKQNKIQAKILILDFCVSNIKRYIEGAEVEFEQNLAFSQEKTPVKFFSNEKKKQKLHKTWYFFS